MYYSWIHTIDQLKYRLHSCTIGNIALARGPEANISLGFALCYIILSTTPLCYISRIVLAMLL